MKVRRFYHPSTVSVEPWHSLREAAAQMREMGFSCLPVVLKGDVIGIITERDLVEAVANGAIPSEQHVVDYMSESPVTVSLDDDSAVAATRMLAVGCRHLPVLEEGRLVGTVSSADLILLAARAHEDDVRRAQVVAVPSRAR
jgi:CBS domain-containing protein